MVNTGTKIYDGIEVRAQKPLDVRTVVTYREDLYKLSSWPHDTHVDVEGNEHHTIYMKEGMTVTVTGTKENPVFEQYMLVDLSKMLNKDYSGWKLLGTGSTPGGGGGSLTGNIDGGRADETYNQSQIIDGGSENGAIVRGETEKE